MKACAAVLAATLAPQGAHAAEPATLKLVEAAKAHDMTRCADTLGKLERRLVNDHDHAYLTDMDDTRGGDHLFETNIIKAYAGTDSQIRITVRANAQGRCEWTYSETSVEEQSCDTLAKAMAANRPVMRFADHTLVISGEPEPEDSTVDMARAVTLSGDPVDLFLTPSSGDKACVVTQREAALGADVKDIVKF